MVRLKDRTYHHDRNNVPHFNSTMVRLKESGIMRYNVVIRFQFHYGTIKRTVVQAFFH